MQTPEFMNAYRWRRQNGKPAVDAYRFAQFDVLNGKARYPKSGFEGWNPQSESGARWVENLSDAGLRLVGYADEVRDLRHRGWYADAFESEVYRGAVLQLPGRNGRARYVAAYADSNDAGAYRVDVSRPAVFEGDKLGAWDSPKDDPALQDAARASDSFAEHEAEEAREYDEAWQAGSEYARLAEEAGEARKSALALLAERRRLAKLAPEAPNACAVIVAKVHALLGEIQEARGARATLAGSVWSKHRDAFNEGAGETVLA